MRNDDACERNTRVSSITDWTNVCTDTTIATLRRQKGAEKDEKSVCVKGKEREGERSGNKECGKIEIDTATRRSSSTAKIIYPRRVEFSAKLTE